MLAQLRWFAAAVILVLWASQVLADASPCLLLGIGRRRPPLEKEPQNPIEYEFVVISDPDAKTAELRIPRRMMVADAGQPPPNPRTAIAALAISAAFIGSGLWCLRYRAGQIPKKTLLAVASLGVVIMVGWMMTGEASGRAQPAPIVSFPLLVDIEVQVRLVEAGNQVELVLPPELANKANRR